MKILAPSLAVLIAAATTATTATAAAPGAERAGLSGAPAMRHDQGSSATVSVSARIVRASASVGVGFAAPMPHMVPRRTTVSAADGRPVAALVYDFE